MAKANHARGFTMVEMVITIVVIGVIFALGAAVLGKAFQSYDLAQKTTDVDWQGRVAMERIARELRDIRLATAADLVFTATSINFNDINNSPVCFRLSGTTLQRSADGPAGICGTTNPRVLADNVTALNFDYYDNAGAVTAVAASVYYITVRLTVSESDVGGGTINETYRVTVQPRVF